jgi:hypothetical protein
MAICGLALFCVARLLALHVSTPGRDTTPIHVPQLPALQIEVKRAQDPLLDFPSSTSTSADLLAFQFDEQTQQLSEHRRRAPNGAQTRVYGAAFAAWRRRAI